MAEKKANGVAKKANGNGSGSLFWSERRDTWIAQVVIDGRTIQRSAGKGKSKAAANRLLAQLLTGNTPDKPAAKRAPTVETYLTDWLKRQKLRPPNTYRAIAAAVNHQLIPALGDIRLDALKRSDIQRALDDLRPKYSNRTVIAAKQHLSGAIKAAIADGIIDRNPLISIKLARPEYSPKPVVEPDKLPAFLRAIQGTDYESLYVATIFTGLRHGEALSVCWPDVDLSRGTIALQGTVTRSLANVLSIEHTKRPKSRRLVYLPKMALDALTAEEARFRQRRAECPDWNPMALVWPGPGGELAKQERVLRLFYKALDAAALPRVRIHDLRHSAATLMLYAGVPLKVVSEALGHAGIAITADLYSHRIESMQAQAATALDRLILGPVDQ